MEIRCDRFEDLSRKGLGDRQLQEALLRVGNRFKETRNAAFSSLKNSEELREQAHGITPAVQHRDGWTSN